jgi:tRNA pseudouridine32 synthase/23S rRNA pseudouridine746 synthase
MCLSPTGRNAVTDIQVVQRGYYGYTIESNPTERRSIPVTKVKLFPITGRRHQLRVHLQSLGHSIVGDYNYQDDYTDTFRMMLHAWKLEAPLTPVPLNVEAPDPFIGLVTTEPP